MPQTEDNKLQDLQDRSNDLAQEIHDLRKQAEEAEARLRKLPEAVADAEPEDRPDLVAEHIQQQALATLYSEAADILEGEAEAVASDISDLDLKQRREEFAEIATEYNEIIDELEEVSEELHERETTNYHLLDGRHIHEDKDREKELAERKRELEEQRDELQPAYDEAREKALLP